MSRKMIILIGIVMCLSVFTGRSRASGDEDLFVTVTTPDALVVLDLSGSMADPPQGTVNNIYVSGTTCNIDGPFYLTSTSAHSRACASGSASSTRYGTPYPLYSSSSCTEPFYKTTGTDHSVICKKIDIAKYALFTLLNDSNTDGLNQITSADVSSLGIRLGLMHFYNCDSTSSPKLYTASGACIKLSWPITSDAQTTATPYANLFCNNSTCPTPNTTGINSCTSPGAVSGAECMVGYGTTGGTPAGYSLREAKSYLDAHKALDDSRTCRQKSVIIVTDGADTYTCNGTGSSTGTSQRRAPVYYAKKLADAGYKVYVVGFGTTMLPADQNVLNWMAYFGGTRNPNATQSGTTSSVSVGTDPCNNGTDPGSYTLSGYAFMASNPAELSSALKSAITSIQEANYSFSSQASVAAARVQQENYLYEASFEPKNTLGSNKEPFWVGHLKKYELNSEGGLITPHCWDAGAKMRDQAETSRKMWTYNGSLVEFNTTNITAADLGVTTDPRRNEVVGFYRGVSTGSPIYNLESWKLGDIFHSNPVAVRTPAAYFYDPRQSGAAAFKSFRTSNQRTAANGNQLILVGANDGQLHAIRAGNGADCTSGGNEVWSFIPPNLLQKMSPVAHNSHASRTTLASHTYFVDGPTEIADVWLPSAPSDGTTKAATDWKTIAIFGEGQGSGSYLWSSSSSCYSTSTSAGFSATYSATYPYYCGYYALDVTNTVDAAQPGYMWHLGFSDATKQAAQAPYLGEAWSKMKVGRVNISGNEQWVGFIGGGFNNAVCESSDTCNAADGKGAGKGFFVVDLTTGNILWSFTHGATATKITNPAMDFSAPAAPLPVDLDNDGFIDTVYMGDMGGNMWRFRLCAKDATCSASTTWTGSLLYQTTPVERGSDLTTPSYSHKQIFTAATATIDTSGNVWVYFGTGENNDPTVKPTDTDDTKNRLYGIKEDPNFTATYTTGSLKNITSTTFCTAIGTGCTSEQVTIDTTTKNGWYINLSTNPLTRSDLTTITSPVGEKMISDPMVFGGVVYFTTHVPDQTLPGESSACGKSGDAFLYGINYLTGSGALTETGADPVTGAASRTNYIGHGIGSAPVLSMRPGGSGITDIYATASGGAGTSALTQKLGNAPSTASMNNILYWKDRRLQ